MLRALDIKAASVAEPLMAAANIIIESRDVAEKPIISCGVIQSGSVISRRRRPIAIGYGRWR